MVLFLCCCAILGHNLTVSQQMYYVLLLCAVGCAVPLILGASILSLTLPLGIPLGNLMALALFIAWAGALSLVAREARSLQRVCSLLVGMACGWFPLSVALSGNLLLQFSDSALQWWLAYTALLILALLIVSVIQAVQAVCRQCRARTTDLAN